MSSKPQAVYPPSPSLPSSTSAILRLFGRGTLWIWVDRCLLSLGTLAAGFLLLRFLAPADYGLYTVALSAGLLGAVGMDLGYSRYAARAVAAQPAEACTIFSLSLLVSFLFGLGQLLVLLTGWLLKNDLVAVISAGLLVGNFGRLHDLTAAFLRAELRPFAMVWASTIGRLGHMIVIFLVVWYQWSVLSLLLGYVLVAIPALALRLGQLRHHHPARTELRWKAFRCLTLRAWPYFSFSLTELGFSHIFILSFSLIATKHEVGLLAAALVIVSLLHQWASATADAVLPLMTRLFEAGRLSELVELRSRVLEGLLIVSMPAVVVLFVFAPQICALLGEKYAGSASILRLLVLRAPLWILEGFLGTGFLNATNRVARRRNAFASALLVLVVFTILFGYLWGPQGAALAIWLATLWILRSYAHSCSQVGGQLHLTSLFAAAGPAALVMAVACISLSDSLPVVLLIPPATLGYFAVLFLIARPRLFSVARTLRECIVG